MSSANHISQDDLYLFALQLLPETEMRSVALHMKDCALCRAQVADIQGDLAVVERCNHAIDTIAPPRFRLYSEGADHATYCPCIG